MSALEQIRRAVKDYCDNGTPQRQFAKRVKVSTVHLNRVIKGHTNPSWDLAERMAKAMGKNLSQILAGRA